MTRPRQDRRFLTALHVASQLRIVRASPGWFERASKQPHRLHKRTATNCGRRHCMLCMNPRRRGSLTMQERRAAFAAADSMIEATP